MVKPPKKVLESCVHYLGHSAETGMLRILSCKPAQISSYVLQDAVLKSLS